MKKTGLLFVGEFGIISLQKVASTGNWLLDFTIELIIFTTIILVVKKHFPKVAKAFSKKEKEIKENA